MVGGGQQQDKERQAEEPEEGLPRREGTGMWKGGVTGDRCHRERG